MKQTGLIYWQIITDIDTGTENRTGHFSRNSLPETIKLKNTRFNCKQFHRVCDDANC